MQISEELCSLLLIQILWLVSCLSRSESPLTKHQLTQFHVMKLSQLMTDINSITVPKWVTYLTDEGKMMELMTGLISLRRPNVIK